MKIATTGENYRGVYADAKVRQTLVAGAAGISAGGDKGVTANVVTVVSGNEVKTDASEASLDAGTAGNTSVTVKAENDSSETVFAGGVSIGKAMGAGASVVVAVARNDVKAQAHNLTAGRDVNVIADNERALSLYRSQGFEEFGRNPRGYQSRISGFQEVVYMLLQL